MRMLLNHIEDGAIRSEIDAERFFAKQVLSTANNVTVKLLMEIVRHSTVYGVHLTAVQQIMIICAFYFDPIKIIFEPRK